MSSLAEILAGALIGLALGFWGRRTRLLKPDGALTLATASLLIWSARGWSWGVVLVAVAVACGLSMAYRRKARPGSAPSARPLGSPQVVARLGWPVALALLSSLSSADYGVPYTGALAAAAADTWATEFGLLSLTRPRSPVSGRPTTAGRYGAISTLGTLAAAGAAGLTGFLALAAFSLHSWLADPFGPAVTRWLPTCALIGGLTASLVDSFLGATARALYYCDACDDYSETPVHDCGQPARHIHGWSWMTREVVDAVGSLVGAGIASATAGLLTLR